MKKLLALVLTLTMVLGTFTFVAAAPEDVVGTDYEEAVARLMALDIIAGFPDGTFKPDEPVTRAQFAKIVVCALGVGEAAQYAAGATKFWDVPADHWATGYINVAVDMGVIAGYPDGTFLPEKEVTFAEAIKMIVAGLGYTPKAEALGGYPGGYLAVAAEEEITDGVNVVGNLAANRGAVAIMVDNALEVNLMEQVSFGDSPRWETVEKTLLKNKLGVEETKGVVTAISKTAKLDENEFELDGKDVYEMVIDVNTESLFLKEVKILHKKEKVVWVSIETAEKDIVFDTIADVKTETIDEEEVEVVTGYKLKVADKTYDLVAGDDFYVNFDQQDPEIGDYGYFIFDGKEIKAACLFRFDEKGFVTAVEDDVIEYVELEEADEDQALELDDYDEIYVYNKDFTKAELDDITEGSVIYYWEGDDDELFIMVVNDVVEGEVTRLRANRVTIDGTNYKTATASVVSVNEGKNFAKLNNNVTNYDIIDEEVKLYLDLNGEIAALVTDAEATSDTLYGIVTWYYEGRNPSIEVFTSEGEEVEYYFAKKNDATTFATTYGNYLKEGKQIVAIEYELNSDGEIVSGFVYKSVVKQVYKDAGRKFVKADGITYYISSDTVLMKAKDGEELDPELVDYDALVDMSLTSEPAIIFGEKGKTAKLIVFTDPDFTGSKDDIYFGVVTDEPWKVGKNWFAEMDIFGEGVNDYKVDVGKVKEGMLVAFRLTGSDKVSKIIWAPVDDLDEANVGDPNDTDAYIVSGAVYKRDGSYLTLESREGPTYRVASDAVIYKLKDSGKIDSSIRLSRIEADDELGGDTVALLIDAKEKEVVAILVNVKLEDF